MVLGMSFIYDEKRMGFSWIFTKLQHKGDCIVSPNLNISVRQLFEIRTSLEMFNVCELEHPDK